MRSQRLWIPAQGKTGTKYVDSTVNLAVKRYEKKN